MVKRFMGYVLAEGIIAMILGVIMLMLPKITSLATAMVLSIVLMIYGLYKFFNSIVIRKQIRHIWLNMILALLIFGVGLYLSINPMFNLLVLTSIIGVYFLLESINTFATTFQTRDFIRYWWGGLIVALLQFVLAIIIIMNLPTSALWTIGLLMGINFLVSGMTMIGLFITTKYNGTELVR